MSKFFSKFDWAAFWVATLVTFGVYFYTLGPSVGLEDSGELATAAAHLGVPHPPGYPFWTFCSWLFCKAFSWVTYMGHPTPAWSVSLCSAVFGSLAAGCASMLICRSAQDLIAPWIAPADSSLDGTQPRGRLSSRAASLLCFAGGVGGSLAFAFSPVEWSQSTIVEIYSLNSFFLLLVFLLSYRWMRQPSDKILWATAFAFGLGLTNYQVLLLAIVPLAIIIAFRNISLFRDFALYLIPVLLTYQVLQIGGLERARLEMSHDAIEKHAPVGISDTDYAVDSLAGYYSFWQQDPSRWPDVVKNARAQATQQRNGLRKSIGEQEKALQKQCQQLDEQIARIGELKGENVETTREYKTIKREIDGLRMAIANGRKAIETQKTMLGDGDRQVEVVRTVGSQARQMKKADWDRASDRNGPIDRSSTPKSPNAPCLILGFVVLVGSLLTALFLRRRSTDVRPVMWTVIGGGAACVLILLLGATFLASSEQWIEAHSSTYYHDAAASGQSLATAPLLVPFSYVMVAIFTVFSLVFAVLSTLSDKLVIGNRTIRSRTLVFAAAGAAVAAILSAYFDAPSTEGLATLFGCSGEPYPWGRSTLLFVAFVIALFAIGACVKNGLAYAIPVAGFHIAVYVLLSRGAMNGLTHPASWWFWWPIVWNFVLLAFVWHMLPHGRSVAGAAFFAQLGAAFYAYMPIVSDWRNPPMNWGYPRTWEGFKHAIERGQYEQISSETFERFGHFWYFIKEQLWYYVRDVKLQFTDILGAVALLPFACWKITAKTSRRPLTLRLLWLALALVTILFVCDSFGLSGVRVLFLLLFLLAAVGLALVLFRQFLIRPSIALSQYMRRCIRRREWLPVCGVSVLVALFLVVPLWLSMAYNGSGKLAIISGFAVCALVLCAANGSAIRRAAHKLRNKVAVAYDAGDVFQQWLISSGICFAAMSIVLMLLAKIQGDVQDGFIQKVKFISSHAMIAIWIGYGLIVVAALLCRKLPTVARRFVVPVLAIGLLLVGALPPLVQNYTNDRLVFELGSAEQNGHTFGWQFGAYQLDGAKAIRAQLTADEEPLPDPEWPAPMEDHAVFFGGTDPGRFVPTYMIYSANYRPDVYLITQNALADQTYMAVERDLYGDEIWIPAREDSDKAFSDFIRNLSPEEKIAYGVDESNGRVQVTGATSVMKINELLVRQMFEKNNSRHAFYVEESYPIDWMYDYLVPHGLILKLMPARTGFDGRSDLWRQTLRKDTDFWDWYTRRLLDDPAYRRDFAAQKSFSKLRCAIAGLATDRSRRASATSESPNAFGVSAQQASREAALLAPISPESNIRSLQQAWCARKQPGEEGSAWSKEAARVLGYVPSAPLLNELKSRMKGTWRLPPYALEPHALDVAEQVLLLRDEKDPYSMQTLRFWPAVESWRKVFQLTDKLAAMEDGGREAALLSCELAETYLTLAEHERLFADMWYRLDWNPAKGDLARRPDLSLAYCSHVSPLLANYLMLDALPSLTDPKEDGPRLVLAAEIFHAAGASQLALEAAKRYRALTKDTQNPKILAVEKDCEPKRKETVSSHQSGKTKQ